MISEWTFLSEELNAYVCLRDRETSFILTRVLISYSRKFNARMRGTKPGFKVNCMMQEDERDNLLPHGFTLRAYTRLL